MNICIITVYNSENCGSFWQAYALADVLKNMGHSVSFLHRPKKNTSSSFKYHFCEFFAKASRLKFSAAGLVWKRKSNYKKAQKCFNIITQDSEELKNVDLFVIGSDTVWNFNSSYFMSRRNIYTGKAFGPAKCITYAVSAANTTYEKFDNADIITSISNLKAISVRDEETRKIVRQLTDRDAKIVCDPTMLVERNILDKHIEEINDKNYILLYQFAPIDETTKKEILELKRKHNLKVISFGEYRSWCDKTIPYDPYAFISYFRNADFIVTDTFHGTIFSILYEKNFAEYGNRKKKIADLLEKLELTDLVRENNESVAVMFERGIDYSPVMEKIHLFRAESMEYLKENLSEK